MRIFGYNFECLDDESLSELFSLQREGAVYTDQWVDKLKDFRHVRIAFTQEEIDEYVRSMWAYELFLSAGSPLQATSVPGIPLDIAERADEYESDPSDPSFHCIAAFLGEKLEELVCYTPDDRRVILGDYGTDELIATVKRAVDSLTPAIRCFNRREKGLSPWPIDREDDIRDLLYAMLRASISDIRREEPVPSVGGTHKFVDLYSRVARLFVEIKWIDKPGRWKKVIEEINDDIQSYAAHPYCEKLVFVIIDAIKDVPDPALIESQRSGSQTINGRDIEILVLIREP